MTRTIFITGASCGFGEAYDRLFIKRIEVMSVAQSCGNFAIHRDE